MLPEDDPRHGKTRGYHAGCRKTCCRSAITRYEKTRRASKGAWAIPALGTQRRIQALMALGWTSSDIAEAVGWGGRHNVYNILRGQKGKPCRWVQRKTYMRVAAVYERLCMTIPPPARQRARTRTLAQRAGYPPPLAWDDIDNPFERPGGIVDKWDEASIDEAVVDRVLAGGKRPRKLTSAEAGEIVARCLGRGMSTFEIERIYGLKPDRYFKGGERVA